MSILSIINQAASTSKPAEKKKVLSSHSDNELLKSVLSYTYDPFKKYGVKEFEFPSEFVGVAELESVFPLLDELSGGFRGNAARKAIFDSAKALNQEDAEVFKRILGKSMKAGFSAGTVNKVFGSGTIPEAPYMGAQSYNPKKVIRLFKNSPKNISQLKLDGRYANVICGENVELESRAGFKNFFGDHFSSLSGISDYFGQEVVLNGELMLRGIENRARANGLINSVVSIGDDILEGKDVSAKLKKIGAPKKLSDGASVEGMEYEEVLSRLYLVCWDYIPLDAYREASSGSVYEVPYIDRLNYLKKCLDSLGKDVGSLVEIVPTKFVATPEDAIAHFMELRDQGMEGTVLKSPSTFWESGKPSTQIKFKQEITVDLEIVGFEFGEKGKANEHLVSTLKTATSDGKLRVSPSNMTREMMESITKNQDAYLGKIVEIKCSGVSQNREGGYSLAHPVVLGIRDDKFEADTLEKVMEIDSASSLLS